MDAARTSRTHDVTVLGSLNLDVVIRVPQVPGAGETVLSTGCDRGVGGKGLNQAVAAARAGASTVLLGAVGSDDAAVLLLETASSAAVDVSAVRHLPGGSGTAWVMVQADGDNAIVVGGAANAALDHLTEAEGATVAAGRVLVAQLETPLSAVGEAVVAARRGRAIVVLNAAPARDLPEGLLDLVDVLVVNQHEARHLTGEPDPPTAASALRHRAGAVVVTLGADGALVVDPDGLRSVPVAPARVVDTTGAGDTFTGYLAASLARGSSLDEACARAVLAGALAVETPGAIASIPTAERLAERLDR